MAKAPLLTRLLLAAATIATCAHAQAVLVVDDNGGPGVYTDLPAAIQAAADGDTLLARDGRYSDATVDKGLTIVGDRNATVTLLGTLTVLGLPAGSAFAAHNLELRGSFSSSLVVQDCAGAVWLADCGIYGPFGGGHFPPGPGGTITRSQAVTLTRCSVHGGTAAFYPSSPAATGLHVHSSTVQLYECTVAGATGTRPSTFLTGEGGAGLAMHNSTVHVQGGSVSGGEGGPGSAIVFLPCVNGGPGGVGAQLSGTSVLETLGTTVVGGGGGTAPPPCTTGPQGAATIVTGGRVVSLAGNARGLSVDHPVREGGTLVFQVTAPAGDLVWLGLSPSATPFPLRLPGIRGPFVVGTAVLWVPVGVAPATGNLQLSARVGRLPPGFEGFTLYAQVLGLESTPQMYLGAVHAVSLVRSGY